jgi:ABC-type sugar transport system ATPase subunit
VVTRETAGDDLYESRRDTVVRFNDVTKRFGRVVAIDGVDLTVQRNEILGLVGDNGAGKSTLMKVLAGVYPPTSGQILVWDQPVEFSDPSDARDLGIETVYQDLALMNDLDIAKNLFMGRFPERFRLGPIQTIDWGETYERADEILQRLGQDLDLKTEVEFLSGGQRQLIAVGRALLFEPEILIFDEPTSALSVAGTELVHGTIRRLQEEGQTQLIVSHSVEDVIDLVDRIAVMYRGDVVAVVDPDEASRELLTEIMTTGRDLRA